MDNLKVGYKADDLRLSGLGGWLSLLGIGIVCIPILLIIEIIRDYIPWFQNNNLSMLYENSPGLHIVVVYEIGSSIFLLGASLYICFLYFRKSRIFVNVMIIYMIINCVIVFIAFNLIGTYVLPYVQVEQPDISRPAIYGLIWGIYLKKSVRVRNTFIR